MHTTELTPKAHEAFLAFSRLAKRSKDEWIPFPPVPEKNYLLKELLKKGVLRKRGTYRDARYRLNVEHFEDVMQNVGAKSSKGPSQARAIPEQVAYAHASPVSRGRHVPTIYEWVEFIERFRRQNAAEHLAKTDKIQNEITEWSKMLVETTSNDERNRIIQELTRCNAEFRSVNSQGAIDVVKAVAAASEFKDYDMAEHIAYDPSRYESL